MFLLFLLLRSPSRFFHRFLGSEIERSSFLLHFTQTFFRRFLEREIKNLSFLSQFFAECFCFFYYFAHPDDFFTDFWGVKGRPFYYSFFLPKVSAHSTSFTEFLPLFLLLRKIETPSFLGTLAMAFRPSPSLWQCDSKVLNTCRLTPVIPMSSAYTRSCFFSSRINMLYTEKNPQTDLPIFFCFSSFSLWLAEVLGVYTTLLCYGM